MMASQGSGREDQPMKICSPDDLKRGTAVSKLKDLII